MIEPSREVKGTFTITGELVVNAYLDEWDTGRIDTEEKSGKLDRMLIEEHIDRELKNKGIKAYEIAIATKSKPLFEEEEE